MNSPATFRSEQFIHPSRALPNSLQTVLLAHAEEMVSVDAPSAGFNRRTKGRI